MAILADKVLVLGCDAMDSRLSTQYMKAGKMPNLKKLLELGSAHDEMMMIGGQPTVTPPMWTTLSTGANPCTHGITDYWAKGDDLLKNVYNFDSRRCKAEPMWNVTAEAGLKTLVWHWPGCAWPPTSNNPNLSVVDGTQPGGVNVGVAEVDSEILVVANINTSEVLYRKKIASDSNVPCFISGMEIEENNELTGFERIHSGGIDNVSITSEETHSTLSACPMDVVFSPIKAAKGWANAPEDAKEFTLLFSKGLIHRPCLIIKNAEGRYDTVKIYKNKRAAEPIAVLPNDVFVADIVDEAIVKEKHVAVNRNMRVLSIEDNAETLRMWISPAMDFSNDTVWHPKTLLKEIVENVGYPQSVSMTGCEDARMIRDCTIANWEKTAQWNADSIKYLVRKYDYKVVFSHFHSVDMQGHIIVQYLKKGSNTVSGETMQELFLEVYEQIDRYIGRFLELLDEGWTILLVSDHGQTCPEYYMSDLVNAGAAVNAVVLEKFGYTVLKRDEHGNKLHEIDWTKTTAVANRVDHIYINLKGRDPEGIVEPEDKYDLEERIMADLYSLRDEKTGYRLCQLALRNKDAILLGMGGPESGDIVYFVNEGFTWDHGDSLSTIDGACGTSVRSVFVAAGKGIKKNYITARYIHHVDVTPTVAALLGLRMPAQAEGAPVYQILESK